MLHGMIAVYKEKGYTSHDVVAKMRGVLGTRKVGHTGTLDPDAEGVLPICVGNGTKLCGMLTDWDKEYVAGVRLGVCTDTQDGSGIILRESKVNVTEEDVRRVISDLAKKGGYLQVPPMYSALKVGGKKLYELARAGVEVERQGRPVKLYELELLDIELPVFRLRVKCSKGTYIRTLAADLGDALGCGGIMTDLVRTEVGFLRVGDCKTIKELEACKADGTLEERIMPADRFFPEALKLVVKPEALKLVQNGNVLGVNDVVSLPDEIADSVRIYDTQGQFYGLYRHEAEENLFRPIQMFFPQ
jgi:tRNA pseudouridine55 synthase